MLQTIHISRFLLRRSGEVNWGQKVKQAIIKTLTPTENDNSQKQGHVAVVQLQRVKLDGEFKLWFHHLTERFPETLEELPRHKNLSIGDEGPIFVHQRRHHDDQNLNHTVLQQSNLKIKNTMIVSKSGKIFSLVEMIVGS